MFSKTTVLMAFQAGLALAGNAILSNNCDYDIWVSSVSGSHETACTLVAAHSQYNETLYPTGTSLKISKTDSIKNGEQTQFEYTIAGGKIWYDISFVNCADGESASNCPGHAEGLSMRGSNSDCSAASCEGGSYCPTQAYYVDQPLIKLGINEPVFDCPTPDVDIHMAVCSGNSSQSEALLDALLINLEGYKTAVAGLDGQALRRLPKKHQ